MPIFIRWNDDSGTSETNPIIPCDITKLDRILQQEEQGSEHLDRSADLNLDDQEFEELLGELHNTLAIDQDSIWKVALRPTSPQKAISEDKELHLRYDEIDYEALRSHPKIRQYLEHGSGAYGTTQTRIGKILHAIANHMQKLLQQGGVELPSLVNAVIPSSEEPEEEPFFEEETGIKEDEPARRWSVRSRIHRVLSRFIQRYLRSLASPEFQQLVGYEVVAKNYLIFSHLLWRLFTKDWLKYDEIIKAFIQSWHLFWGDRTIPGYFYQLSIEEQLEIWEWMRYYRNDALMLAAYYFAALIVVKEQKEDLRFSIRDSWRNFLSLSPFPLTPDVLEDTQKLLEYLLPYRPPKATEIANELTQLAYFETQRHVIATLVADGYLPAGNCSFRKEPVQRKSFGLKVSVDCLAIDSSATLSTKEAAILLLQAWMQVEWLDYYRIASKEPNDVHEYRYLIFYDMKEQGGKYSVRGEDGKPHAEDIPQIQLPVKSWEAGLKHLRETARQATRAVSRSIER